MIALAVDPGGASTGVVLCDGATCLHSRTVSRLKGEPVEGYATRVADEVQDVDGAARQVDLLAVEAVVPPNPHVRVTNVAALLDTAIVYGRVTGLDLAPLVVVQPDGHGSHLLASYPSELRPARGKGCGRDALRHERSAYDIAQAGVTQWRTQHVTREAVRR